MIVTRFAPSPNGHLHLGHAYSSIVAHDLARAEGGRFLMRIEDIDGERSKPELADEFRRDLEWLGLEWEEVPAQSTRIDTYREAANRLAEMELLYPCQCSRAQIAEQAAKQGPEGPIYPGTCKCIEIDKDAPVAWRLDVERAAERIGALEWEDEVAGSQKADPSVFGDVILVRKALPASYHLAATLDDAADGITLVTRGADLFQATHIHRLLQALLGLPVPRWHHHPLLLDETGKKLAKRRGSASLADLRNAGEDGPLLAKQLRSHILPTGISFEKA
ncbi:tRNA glutamyl-Q(34) synthetase GluQRS [Altererythrobacter lutimaris]|uniref:tRNA glutamyl-Q(34) synthetase GluQRS n=1 Tax=Altererythrobacter lutimaris TaxID=2743979 RepID=A0A850HAQ1_9SPHN|nr:tRNA glutamyl-Q(34) synthetase GluQRS [Altererythrobacter lutimaris]NVE95093.1 tRNA glutamyl-Q(34) synthetase GluQRS [Altererythrobacter lutimaris]